MYEFAILLLGGLITAKTVSVILHLINARAINKAATLLMALVFGVGYAFLFNFSMFAGWAVAVRAEWIGVMATGLFMGGLATLWDEVSGVLSGYAHRYRGEPTEVEARLQKAA